MLDLQPKRVGGTSTSERKVTRTATDSDCGNTTSVPWTEKYAPQTVSELKLHHSKHKPLSAWFESASEFSRKKIGQAPLLVVFGGSGTGKNLAVRLVGKEMNATLVEWTDDLWECDQRTAGNSFSSSREDRNIWYRERNSSYSFTSGMSHCAKSLFSDDYGRSKTLQWQEFSLRSRYPSLDITGGSTAAPAVLPSIPTKSRAKKRKKVDEDDLLPPLSKSDHRVLIIRDPVALAEGAAAEQSADFYQTLVANRMPTIIVLSDALGKEDQSQLTDKYLPPSVRNSMRVEWLFWPPATETKIIKILQQIRISEKIKSSVCSDEAVDIIAANSSGDIRHAILDLYLFTSIAQAPNPVVLKPKSEVTDFVDLVDTDDESDGWFLDRSLSTGTSITSSSSTSSSLMNPSSVVTPPASSNSTLTSLLERDLSFSNLRVVSKILHNKLNVENQCETNLDSTITQSNTPAEYLLTSLQYQTPENLEMYLSTLSLSADSQIEAISSSLDHFSSLDLWQTRKYDPSSHVERNNGLSFPDEYVLAVASRILPIAKGVGCLEKLQIARQSGFKLDFRGLKSSTFYTMRQKQRERMGQLDEAKREFAQLMIDAFDREDREFIEEEFAPPQPIAPPSQSLPGMPVGYGKTVTKPPPAAVPKPKLTSSGQLFQPISREAWLLDYQTLAARLPRSLLSRVLSTHGGAGMITKPILTTSFSSTNTKSNWYGRQS